MSSKEKFCKQINKEINIIKFLINTLNNCYRFESKVELKLDFYRNYYRFFINLSNRIKINVFLKFNLFN